MLTSKKMLDNVILTQERYVYFGCNIRVGVIKTAGNIRIYFPVVFCVRSGPNQFYSPEYGWECLSQYSKWR